MAIMKFAKKDIKLKSNWFDEGGMYSRIGHECFLVYLNLYRFVVPNQDKETFVTSTAQLKKITGLTLDKTYEAIKKLSHYGAISHSVTRWDRCGNNDLIYVYAEDSPNMERRKNVKSGKEYDHPVTKDDYYVVVNLPLIQHYMDLKYDGREMAFYCLLRKLSARDPEGKCYPEFQYIYNNLRISKDKIFKMIVSMHRNYLLYARRRRKVEDKNGKKQTKYKNEYYIGLSLDTLETHKTGWMRPEIDKNLVRWDKKKIKDTLTSEDDFEVVVDGDITVDIHYEPEQEESFDPFDID